MMPKKQTPSPARVIAAIALLAASASLGGLLPAAAAAPAATAIEPTTVQGGHDYSSAASVVYDTVGQFYGVNNASSGAIETIRGYLAASSMIRSDFYKIDLPRGKVLDVRLETRNPVYVPFGNGQRISPDFELFTYAGIPSGETMIDWNIAPFTNRVWQENNILTPISPSATYYINVSVWYGQGEYNLIISVSDPTPVTGGDYAGNLDQESQNPNNQLLSRDGDTFWYRFSAVHDTNNQVFQEASGWLEITNWNTLDPTQVDAVIRIFAEDTGYSPTNPIGKPIEKSEAPNRRIEPFSILCPYTGTYYIMLRLSNQTSAAFNLHFNLTTIPRFPDGGLTNIHKERVYDDTDWFWFNMSKGSGTQANDRVVFNMSETSDNPLMPVNLNLWLFGYRDYFRPGGNTADFDILNSSFEGDAPYNLTLNPEPRHEEVAAQAMYTGIYFLEVEDYNNSGNYSVTKAFDTSSNRQASDYNNEPSQAAGTDWGRYTANISQSEDHTDFYKVSAQAGETIEVTFDMAKRSSPDGPPPSVANQTMGLIWIGIYQPGMQLLSWGWNYHFDYANNQPTDYLESSATARATVAADGDYIVEVTAMQDGFIGPFTLPGMPPRTLQVFWHMDWNFATAYTVWISRLPTFNAQFESPLLASLLPDISLQEGTVSNGVYDLADYFYDPDVLQGDTLNYTFTFSGMTNLSITEAAGLVHIEPLVNPTAQPPVDNTNWHGTNTVQVRATDQQRNYVSQYWNITYLPVNDAPYLVSSSPIGFAEDSGVVVLALVNYIRDYDGDTLSFAQVPDANITLAFTPTTMRVTTAPDFQTTTLGAPYSVFVDVFDGTVTVRLELAFDIVNRLDVPRVRTSATNVSCDEDVTCPLLDLNTIFFDPDDPLHRQALNFLVSGNGEIAYDLFNGSLLLRPPADWSGAKTIQVQAIKFSGASPPTPYPSDVVEINLIVREINDPPRVLSWTPALRAVTVTEGATRSFTVDAEDPEHLQPTFRWYLDDVSLENTLPTYSFLGLYTMSRPNTNTTFTLRVVIADGAGGEEIHEWDVTVIDLPRPPLVTIASPLEGNRGYERGQPVTFFASAFDPDGDVLAFSWTIVTTGQEILASGNGTHVFDQTGTLKIQLSVTDGVNTILLTVNVTIAEPKVESPGFDTPVVLGALGAVAAVGAVMSRRRRVA